MIDGIDNILCIQCFPVMEFDPFAKFEDPLGGIGRGFPAFRQFGNRIPIRTDFNQIVAASNFKQRTRMALLYYHAELRRYAVVGTPNKDEHDQGFFVKWGDGGYDIGPIRHLFKTQVYQLAEYLGIKKEIREATPTSDTYSAPSSQQEFFFQMPFEIMDRLWFALENGVAPDAAASALGIEVAQVERAYAGILQKINATEYLRAAPIEYGVGHS